MNKEIYMPQFPGGKLKYSRGINFKSWYGTGIFLFCILFLINIKISDILNISFPFKNIFISSSILLRISENVFL